MSGHGSSAHFKNNRVMCQSLCCLTNAQGHLRPVALPVMVNTIVFIEIYWAAQVPH